MSHPAPALATRTLTLLTAVITLTTVELLRVAGTTTGTSAGAATLTVLGFAGAALAGPAVWWLGVRSALPAAVAGLALARLVVQFPAGRTALIVAVALALALVSLVLAVRRCAAAGGTARALRAVALAVAADVALRVPLDLWDPVWRGGLWGWGVALALAASLAVLAREAYHAPPTATPAGASGPELGLLGPLLALYGVFLAAPGYVAAQAGISTTAAGLWIATGSLLGVWALSWPSAGPPKPSESSESSESSETLETSESSGSSGAGFRSLPGFLPGRLAGARVPTAPLRAPVWAVPTVLVAAALTFFLLPGNGVLVPVATAVALAVLPAVTAAALGRRLATGRGALVDLAVAGGGGGLAYAVLVLPVQLRIVPGWWPVLGAVALAAAAWFATASAAAAATAVKVPAGRAATALDADATTDPDADATTDPDAEITTEPDTDTARDPSAAPASAPAPTTVGVSPRLSRPFLPLLLATLLLAYPPLANAVRSAPAPLPTDTAGGAYRLLSWNVHFAVKGDGEVVPDEILGVIRDSGAHVVVLQEVPRGWSAAGGLDLVGWLERRLDAEAVWSPAADRQFGNVILTSLPVVDRETGSLPRGDGRMDRSYASVTVRLADGETARIATTHLEGGGSGAASSARASQLQEVLAALDRGHHAHTVLAGDFNAEPDSRIVDTVLEAGFTSAQDVAGNPDRVTHVPPHRRVDWIFGGEPVTFEHFRILDSPASDHLPLTVTVWLD
ncbi:endonuclease/exonuclease/phosphatase family protein [Streptomyces sp. 4N509B]|uniref:endonuclease/exonuclease/phosphatase family protein n=1 Tax=Streptomyces sp. 4N509B TaxID=3457413 RepID=UPI003FD5D900